MRICNARGWTMTTDSETLKNVITPPLGPRHHPLNHAVALDTFRNRLTEDNISISAEKGMLSPDNMKYVYLVEITLQGIKDLTFNLGFINYNNKQKSLTVLAGERVMVCSNETFTGQIQESKRKHTNNIMADITDKFNMGLSFFKTFTGNRLAELNRFKQIKFEDTELGKAVLYLHRNSAIGNTDINRIIGEFDKPTFDYGTGGHTAYDFVNASSHVLKGVDDPLRRINLNLDVQKFVNKELMGVEPTVASIGE